MDGTVCGNLNVEVNVLEAKTLENVDHTTSVSRGMNIGVQGKTGSTPYEATTLGVQYANSGHNAEGYFGGTIGQGTVKVAGENVEEGSLNRDITATLVKTEDRDLGGMNVNVEVNIDNILHPVEQWEKDLASMKETNKDIANLTEDVADTAEKTLSKDPGTKDNGGMLKDFQNKRNVRAAAEEFALKHPELAAVLNGPKGPEQDAAMEVFNKCAAEEFNVKPPSATESFDGDKFKGTVADNAVTPEGQPIKKSETNAMYDPKTGAILINAAKQEGSTEQLLTDDGHELKHHIDAQTGRVTTEAGSNRFGSQLNDAVRDEIGAGMLASATNAGVQSGRDYSAGNGMAEQADVVEANIIALLNTNDYGHISYVIGSEEEGYTYFSKHGNVGPEDGLKEVLGFDFQGIIVSGKVEKAVPENGKIKLEVEIQGGKTEMLFDKGAVIKTSAEQDHAAIANAKKQQENLVNGKEVYDAINANCGQSFVESANAGGEKIENGILPKTIYKNTLETGKASEIKVVSEKGKEWFVFDGGMNQ